MTKKLAAALIAALLALSAIPLVASPAAAHDKRTQRCDYDPISGQNFNCRSVYVPRTHPKPKTQGPEANPNANPDSSGNLGEDPPDTDPSDDDPPDDDPPDDDPLDDGQTGGGGDQTTTRQTTTRQMMGRPATAAALER